MAKDNFNGFATTGKKRKRRTGELAGDPAYHFTAQDGAGNFVEEFLAVHDGSQVTFGVVLTGTQGRASGGHRLDPGHLGVDVAPASGVGRRDVLLLRVRGGPAHRCR